MSVAGIVAEYNPMHSGHLYHLRETRERCGADVVVAVMSGTFSQRGEPTIYDKWLRAGAAVKNGVDLVFELPFIYACNSAEYFGTGAVRILDGLGCVTHISFGSEVGDVGPLSDLAAFLADEPEAYREALKAQLEKGISFPRARQAAVAETYGNSQLLREPNNILAIEYLKGLRRIGSGITPVTIQRKGAGHHESATEIRNSIEWDESRYYDMVRQAFLKSDSARLGGILAASEGIANRIKKNLRRAKTLDELIDLTKSKRYTWTGINRLLAQTLIGLTEENFFKMNGVRYGRILAFNDTGAKLLRTIKKKELAAMPILTNLPKDLAPWEDDEALTLSVSTDVLAADLYNLAFQRDLYDHSDFVMKPAYIRQI
jgi:predicted nucleotidyltransferase